MAITIQELIASDTISQAVDKINFNFDQLLLNGGGPVGPAGPIGPSGPIGGRGERGTEWYEGTDNPNVTPPTITPLQADYYLQSNGDVWEYTGLAWTNTGINLTGPQGPTGSSIGWSQFGNAPNPGSPSNDTYSATAKNVSYPSLMNQLDNTLNANNEGVPVAAFGIAGPNDNDYPGIPLTSAFKLNTLIAGQLDSSKLSTFIHQKDSGTRSIVFMGGGNIPGENFEQNDLDKMVNISIGTDDKLLLNVPKKGTIGATTSDLAGLLTTVDDRGASFRVGNNFIVDTGIKGTQDFANDNSDVRFKLGTLAGAAQPAEFNVTTIGTGGNNRFAIGGGFTPPALDPGFDGDISIETNNIYGAVNSIFAVEVGSELKLFNNTPGNSIGLTPTAITLNAGGASTINASTSGGDITLQSTNGGETNVFSNTGTSMKTGNSNIETDEFSIRLIGGGTDPNNNIKIYSALPGSSVSLGLGGGNQTGKIQIGQRMNGSNWQDFAAIELDYANVSTGIINLRGAIQYDKEGTVPFANAADQSIFFRTNTMDYDAGDTLIQIGKPDDYLNGGVAMLKFNDYAYDSITIGKADAQISASLGIFVNGGGDFAQGETTAFQPPEEAVGITKSYTHLSNSILWGGSDSSRGVQVEKLDTFQQNPVPMTNHTVTLQNKSRIKIIVGPTASGPHAYNFTNAGNGNIGSSNASYIFTLPEPSIQYKGQTIIVEVFVCSGRLELQDRRDVDPINWGPLYTLTTTPTVTLRWPTFQSSLSFTPFYQSSGPISVGAPSPFNGYAPVIQRWVGMFVYDGEEVGLFSTSNTVNGIVAWGGTTLWSQLSKDGQDAPGNG